MIFAMEKEQRHLIMQLVGELPWLSHPCLHTSLWEGDVIDCSVVLMMMGTRSFYTVLLICYDL